MKGRKRPGNYDKWKKSKCAAEHWVVGRKGKNVWGVKKKPRGIEGRNCPPSTRIGEKRLKTRSASVGLSKRVTHFEGSKKNRLSDEERRGKNASPHAREEKLEEF